jgi:hypothetical protein
MKKFVWGLVLALCVGYSPECATGDEIRIEIDERDTPVRIIGKIGEKDSFQSMFRLIARGANVRSFNCLPSDLRRKEGRSTILRRNIHLSRVSEGDGRRLDRDVPVDWLLSVEGVQDFGEYEGVVEIAPELPGEYAPLKIPLQVSAKVKPVLSPMQGSDNVKLNLVNCEWKPNRWVAHMLLQPTAFLDALHLQFENPTSVPVNIDGYSVLLIGGQAGNKLTEQDLYPTRSKDPTKKLTLDSDASKSSTEKMAVRSDGPLLATVSAKRSGSLSLSYDRTNIPSDSYSGNIVLNVEGAESPVHIPVTMNVRTGPLWPLTFLLAGIGLGRLGKYMQERGRHISEALEAVNEVQYCLEQAHEWDAKVLTPTINRIREMVYRAAKLDQVKPMLEDVEVRLGDLSRLRDLESLLAGHEGQDQAKTAQEKIDHARNYLAAGPGSHEKAKALIDEVTGLIGELPTVKDKGASVFMAIAPIDKALREQPAPTAPEPVKGTLRQWFGNMGGHLAGLRDVTRAEATYWILRPLLYLVLMGVLLAIGLQSLYLEKGATFGANPLTDYLSLLFWGLSAEVASKTLSTIKGQ